MQGGHPLNPVNPRKEKAGVKIPAYNTKSKDYATD